MKKLIFIMILVCWLPKSFYAQDKKMGFIVGASYVLTGGDSRFYDLISLSNYKANFGIEFFRKLDLSLELGFMNATNGRPYKGEYIQNIKTLKLGAEGSYRFLKDFVISPKISFGGGFFPYSNLNGKHTFINYSPDDCYYQIDLREKTLDIFGKWITYINANLFISLKFKSLVIDIGGGVNYTKLCYRHYSKTDFSDSGKQIKKWLKEKDIAIKVSYFLPFK